MLHNFTFVVSGVDAFADDFEDRFYEAGCDDATLALMHGAVVVSFDREAPSYKEAVLSAYRDVVNSGATLKRFEPDYLVSAAEIAARAGLSRAAVSLFENGERGQGYPEPYARVTTSSPLWDWVEVSKWLCLRGNIDEAEYRSALLSRVINYHVHSNSDYEAAAKGVSEAMDSPLAA
ncbi:MAG: hypothetical protein AB3N13_13135 [Arenibacterium sp.]